MRSPRPTAQVGLSDRRPRRRGSLAARPRVRGARLGVLVLLALLTVAGLKSRRSEMLVNPATAQPGASAIIEDTEGIRGGIRAGIREGASLWQKRWWIDRTARLLRGGEGLGPEDDLDALLPLSKEEIARGFMLDERFGDAILDFNLFFLGFKSDHLKNGSAYDRTVFDVPTAVAAAQALLEDGDYFKLFELEGPFYMAPLRSEPLDEPPQPGDEGLTPPQLRSKAMREIEAVFADALAFARTKPAPRLAQVCKAVESLADSGQTLTPQLHRAFDDAEIFALIRGEVLAKPLEMLATVAEKACDERTAPSAARKSLLEGLESAVAQIKQAFSAVGEFEPDRYQPKSVLEFKRFALSAFPTKQTWLSFGFEQGMALGNSSTNFNRKRAAYVLKRFFCDDLIPIGFESPQEHVAGVHGSQPSCYACHHKLDPMARCFPTYGPYCCAHPRRPHIIFDDLASKDRALYEAVWKAASKLPAWNIGYIRSARYQSYNSYGTSMGDLSRILRTAPEVKRCLVKRLHEYILAEDQTIDGGYLDYLTREFEAEAAANTSHAFKSTIVRLLQSAAYEQRDADPKRCYDRAPGSLPGEGPPCRVAFILSKNCAQCHNAAADDGAARLDVGSWILAPDGQRRIFRHLDDKWAQLSARDSLARVIERLSSSDVSVRMPKGRVMGSDERQELFLWAQEELARILERTRP